MAFDSGMAKMLMFCFVFIAGFVLMLPLIPGDFAVSTKEYSDLAEKVPDYWNGINLMSYNFTGDWNTTLTASAYQWNFDVGGRNLRLEENVNSGNRQLFLSHRYGFGLLWTEAMDWYDIDGKLVSSLFGNAACMWEVEVDADFLAHNASKFDVVCLGLGQGSSSFQVTVFLSFNASLYDLPSEAWDSADLDLFVGITQENTNTAMDAWSLIASLLTFNTMEVFGSSGPEILALNALIVLPIYAAIIIPVAVFTLEALDRILPF